MARVILKNVSIDRGDSAAEAGLNLEIGDRELVVLTGPAGCGISTIVRMIAGLEPSRGEILLGERRVDDVSPKDRDVALVSGDYAPYPRLTVYDNLALGLERRNFPKPEIKKRVLAATEIMGLQELLERNGYDLSAEERQRIALARAMVLQPKVFLFDESFAPLDKGGQVRARHEVKKLHQRSRATMIYATHDPIEAMAIGDRMVVIDRRIVQQDGSAQSIHEEPANLFVAGFVGDPAMNLVAGSLKQERVGVLCGEAGDGTIEVGLRS
jgi:multiple sugar transport system ATP-binding protein